MQRSKHKYFFFQRPKLLNRRHAHGRKGREDNEEVQWTERTARLTTYHVDNLCGKHHLSCEEVMKVLTEIYVRFHNLSKEKLRKKKREQT